MPRRPAPAPVQWHAPEVERVHHQPGRLGRHRPVPAEIVSHHGRIQFAVVGQQKRGNCRAAVGGRQNAKVEQALHRLGAGRGAVERLEHLGRRALATRTRPQPAQKAAAAAAAATAGTTGRPRGSRRVPERRRGEGGGERVLQPQGERLFRRRLRVGPLHP
eukprot:scaffold5358_cov92-Isochrysis_galbana.AAC.2